MKAAVNTSLSFVLSLIFTVLLLATLQLGKPWFNSSQVNIILGGFMGSWIFIFLLTAISNFEQIILGEDFQAKFLPEIAFCLVAASLACGVVHRVCATTCILFSIVGLYFVNKISQNFHNASYVVTSEAPLKKRRK